MKLSGKKIIQGVILSFVLLVSLAILGLNVKGGKSDPFYYQRFQDRAMGGPFESSNSTARYALTEAIVENKSLSFTEEQAEFSSPDLVFNNNKFYSIFTPGISFFGIPFYMLGKMLGAPQLVTYIGISLSAFINMLLIAMIAKRLGASLYAGLLGGFLFLFATNALAYAQSYTQHHVSTTLLLAAILTAFGKRTVIKNILFGFFVGAAALVDMPNIFLLVPVGLYILWKHISVEQQGERIKTSVQLSFITILLALLPFIAVFGWYNQQTTGSYTTLGQSLGRTQFEKVVKVDGKYVLKDEKADKNNSGFSLPFNTRNQIVGAYTLLISDERSWLFYSPVVLLGILGMRYFYQVKKHIGITNMILGVILMNIILYTMFGDPWGGWAFGPRYLIPAAAAMCVFLATAVHNYGKNMYFSILFFILAAYSIFVSILGALTTSSIPPKQEAIHLLSQIPYTYEYNLQLIQKNELSSLLYNAVFAQLVPGTLFAFGIGCVTLLTTFILHTLSWRYAGKEDKKR